MVPETFIEWLTNEATADSSTFYRYYLEVLTKSPDRSAKIHNSHYDIYNNKAPNTQWERLQYNHLSRIAMSPQVSQLFQYQDEVHVSPDGIILFNDLKVGSMIAESLLNNNAIGGVRVCENNATSKTGTYGHVGGQQTKQVVSEKIKPNIVKIANGQFHWPKTPEEMKQAYADPVI